MFLNKHFYFYQIKIEEKHPLLIAFGNIGSEDYVLEVLKKTKSR